MDFSDVDWAEFSGSTENFGSAKALDDAENLGSAEAASAPTVSCRPDSIAASPAFRVSLKISVALNLIVGGARRVRPGSGAAGSFAASFNPSSDFCFDPSSAIANIPSWVVGSYQTPYPLSAARSGP
ncbi:hypothetical protein [Bradyrhizobium sp.]|uniref:hypothetical protein n=1 Tax=Bradyrhizobium sp. TaxID=376 RepID=UPI00263504B9|nr:hypothetical protein [Bradyrhizobium sp.]